MAGIQMSPSHLYITGDGILQVPIYCRYLYIAGTGILQVLVYCRCWYITDADILQVLVYCRAGACILLVLVYYRC